MAISNVSSNLRPGVCTSTTRPVAPYEGQAIYETDTDLYYIYDGSTWERVVVLDSLNRVNMPASMTVVTESSAGRGLGIRAGVGDTTPPTLQFTNNSISTQWGSITAPSDQTMSLNTSVLQRNGSSFINIVDIGIETYEWNMSVSSGSVSLSTNIPTSARYIYADVFITSNLNDHFNLELSNSSCATFYKNWVDTRGQQPSTQFGSQTARRSVYCTYNGEVDGYTPNYGMWYSGLSIPTGGRTLYWGCHGSSLGAWVYLKLMGYST